jgi:hypothetical protein
MWIDWSSAAEAATTCEPFEESAFRASVFDAQSGIDRGDVELATGIVDAALRNLPCLDAAVDTSLWADLLVSWAIVEHSRGGDWEGPLSAALRLRKGIDRGVGPGHPIYDYEPAPVGLTGAPVPPSGRLFVDGRPSPVVPPSDGVWLVQRTDGRFWNTRLLADEALPAEWAAERVVGPPRVVVTGRVGLSVGVGASSSTPGWPTDRFVAASPTGVPLGGGGDLRATFWSPFGAYVAARASWYPRSPGIDARALGIASDGVWTVGAGFAGSTVDVFQRELDLETSEVVNTVSNPVARYVVGAVALTPRHRPLVDGARALDAMVTAGGSRSGLLVDAEVGVATGVGERAVRLGAVGTWREAGFGWTGVPGSRLDTTVFRLLLRADLMFGEY